MLTREQIATRAARELSEGDSVHYEGELARLVASALPFGIKLAERPTSELVDVSFVTAHEVTPLGEFAGTNLTRHAKKVIVLLEHHLGRDGVPAIRKHCREPLAGVAQLVITSLAVFDVAGPGLIMREVAPGVSAIDVQQQCDAPLLAADDLKVIHV